VFIALVHLSVVVGIVVVDERWQEACIVGVRNGVCGQVLEVFVKGFPFLKEVESQCRFLLHICNEDGVIIVVEWVDNSGCVGFGKFAGRGFS